MIGIAFHTCYYMKYESYGIQTDNKEVQYLGGHLKDNIYLRNHDDKWMNFLKCL